MKKNDFEVWVKVALNEKPKLPNHLEAVLFAQAEDLLSKRREQIVSRKTEARQRMLSRRRWLSRGRLFLSQLWETIAFHPERPATAAIVAVFVVATLTLYGGSNQVMVQLSYANLPPLPKNNDFPAQYDAQILAERQAYEREVQDAHRRTSGGI